MKHRKKYFFFSLINVVAFVLSCLLCSFSWGYKVDSFSNQLVSYVSTSTERIETFPMVSMSSKEEKFDFSKIFNNVYYNHYVPYYRCAVETKLSYSDSSDPLNISILSQPTFWSEQYKTSNDTFIYKLDHSSYFLKYKSEFNSHGFDAFFYLSQSLATYICEQESIEEEALIGRIVEFTDKNQNIKQAYVSNIVVDGYGLADYQNNDLGHFVLSYVLFDPRVKDDFNARFDIKMKVNPRGNSSIIETCLSCCPKENYNYDFFTFSNASQTIERNEKLSQKFSKIKKTSDFGWIIGVAVLATAFAAYLVFKIYFYKKNTLMVVLSSIIPSSLFVIIGIIFSFIYTYYLFGLFSIIFLGLELPFLVYFAFNYKIKEALNSWGAENVVRHTSFYTIKI